MYPEARPGRVREMPAPTTAQARRIEPLFGLYASGSGIKSQGHGETAVWRSPQPHDQVMKCSVYLLEQCHGAREDLGIDTRVDLDAIDVGTRGSIESVDLDVDRARSHGTNGY